MQSRLTVILSLSLGAACAPDDQTPTATCSQPAAVAAKPVGGDANGDGFADVSDGIYLQRHLFSGGPAPACPDAVDVLPEGVIDAGDAPALWSHLGPQVHATLPPATGCSKTPRGEEPACGDGLTLAVSAPSTVSDSGTARFDATVELTAGGIQPEGWQLVVSATGCSITAATLAGTVAADVNDDPPGARDGGYAWVDTEVGPTARSMVVLDWRKDGLLPGAGTAQPVLALQVEAPVGADCTPCTLMLGPVGDRLDTVVAGQGYRYTPILAGASVSVCPG